MGRIGHTVEDIHHLHTIQGDGDITAHNGLNSRDSILSRDISWISFCTYCCYSSLGLPS